MRESADRYESWKAHLASLKAFDPIVIGAGGQSHFRAHLSDATASEAGAPPSLVERMPEFNPDTDTIGSGEIIALK